MKNITPVAVDKMQLPRYENEITPSYDFAISNISRTDTFIRLYDVKHKLNSCCIECSEICVNCNRRVCPSCDYSGECRNCGYLCTDCEETKYCTKCDTGFCGKCDDSKQYYCNGCGIICKNCCNENICCWEDQEDSYRFDRQSFIVKCTMCCSECSNNFTMVDSVSTNNFGKRCGDRT